MRYACFPATRRLAIQQGGRTRVYDTGEHVIGGFSQQQGGDRSLTFNSQFGLVRVADLPVVSPATNNAPLATFRLAQRRRRRLPRLQRSRDGFTPGAKDDIFALIERLADLRAKNILTDEEFNAKKTELLSRL